MFENLSPIDFEDLCRDIAQAHTGNRFSAFGPGPDGGIDGRHAKDGHSTVLQCKHFQGSPFATLLSAAKAERAKLDKLKPGRYLFFTSQSLTPKKSDQLAEALGGHLKSPDDIWGKEDLEAALRKFPDIEKSHLKLWLSSAGVLDRILNAGLEAFTNATKEEIKDELKVYVKNKSFNKALSILESKKILIISGPPGVGKTTLAKMLSYSYLNDGWAFYAIKNLDDGFAKINDRSQTIFFFDDFLGRIELNRQALLQNDSLLASFSNRVRNSKNCRFILTTRAHIFEEARQVSDHVDDGKLQLSKYILDVGAYTRRVKSYILFNHLSTSPLTQAHFDSLLKGDSLKKIVDHKNYNPRVISSTSSQALEIVNPEEYPSFILNALDCPQSIWDKPFKSIDLKSQNLLIVMFFCDEFGVDIDQLRQNFAESHRLICSHHLQPTKPTDFEIALKSLESGFIAISGSRVSFVNPSVRDYLASYLVHQDLLRVLAQSAKRADWANKLWGHCEKIYEQDKSTLRTIGLDLANFAKNIEAFPTQKKIKNGAYYSFRRDDMPLAHRAQLLFELWEGTKSSEFLEFCLKILQNSNLTPIPEYDGRGLAELHYSVDRGLSSDSPYRELLLEAVTQKLAKSLTGDLSTDELLVTYRHINEFFESNIPDIVRDALVELVENEFAYTGDLITDLQSESELKEHAEYIHDLAEISGVNSEEATKAIRDRINHIQENQYEHYEPSIAQQSGVNSKDFTDADLYSVFGNLRRIEQY